MELFPHIHSMWIVA